MTGDRHANIILDYLKKTNCVILYLVNMICKWIGVRYGYRSKRERKILHMKLRSIFDQEINRSVHAFFADYIKRYSVAYILILSAISVFEAIMLVRAFFLFDFTNFRHQLYFISYVFLLGATLLGVVLVVRNNKGMVSANTITIALHVYCSAIIVWSLLISYLDISRGNTPIVYLTVIMSIGGLTVLYPSYYAINLVASFCVLLSFRQLSDTPFFDTRTGGVYVNLIIFVIVSALLSIRHYRISMREMRLTHHLEKLSYCDQLTELNNRRMYDEALEKIDSEGEDIWIGIIDVDAFKTVNDTYGHDFGDRCLKEVARSLQSVFGNRSYRIGGDEFAVICEPCEISSIKEQIQIVNQRLAEAFPDKQVSISAGFGRHCTNGDRTLRDVIEAADQALYTAKKSDSKCCFAG